MLMSPPPQGNVWSQNRTSYNPTQTTPGLQQNWGGQANAPGFQQLTPGPQTLGGNQSANALNMSTQYNQMAKSLGFRS